MAGFDSTCGLACRTFMPSQRDALLVALARSHGAIPFVRTAVPQLLLTRTLALTLILALALALALTLTLTVPYP